MRLNASGDIDHDTLPDFVRVKHNGEEGRSLGAMISVLTRAVQQLEEENERLKQQVEADWIKQFQSFVLEAYGNILNKREKK